MLFQTQIVREEHGSLWGSHHPRSCLCQSLLQEGHMRKGTPKVLKCSIVVTKVRNILRCSDVLSVLQQGQHQLNVGDEEGDEGELQNIQ